MPASIEKSLKLVVCLKVPLISIIWCCWALVRYLSQNYSWQLTRKSEFFKYSSTTSGCTHIAETAPQYWRMSTIQPVTHKPVLHLTVLKIQLRLAAAFPSSYVPSWSLNCWQLTFQSGHCILRLMSNQQLIPIPMMCCSVLQDIVVWS